MQVLVAVEVFQAYRVNLQEKYDRPDIELLRDQFAPRPSVMPEVTVVLPSTSVYDELLEAA